MYWLYSLVVNVKHVAMVTDSQLLTQSIFQLNVEGQVSYYLLLWLQ